MSDASVASPADARAPGRLAGVHPVLFAAYPVLFLWSQNLGETDPADVIPPLVVLVVATALVVLAIGRLVGDRRRIAFALTPVVVGLLMYGHVRDLVSDLVPGIRPFVHQAAWAGLVLIALVLAARLSRERLARLDQTLTGAGAILVAVTLATIVPFQATALAQGRPEDALQPLPTTTTAQRRDVYWLVMDRYGSDRSLALRFGTTETLTPWLREHGFTVLDDSHANYVRTALSMGTSLNLEHAADLVPGMPSDSSDLSPLYETLQGPLVVRQFQALGYAYHHIGSWWRPTREDVAADVNYHAPGFSDFVDTLIDSSALPAAAKRLGIESALGGLEQVHYANNTVALDTLDRLVDEPGPKFVLAHILLPHTPYVFDRDGSFVSEEAAEGRPIADQHDRQFAYTNLRLRQTFERLQALPEDRSPIIILQADEGPWTEAYARSIRTYDWATATPDELEQKFGIINAWYLPGGEDLGLYPEMSAINTFPVLFSRYFGLDYPTLPDRVYTSRAWRAPYDLTEITDLLPSLR